MISFGRATSDPARTSYLPGDNVFWMVAVSWGLTGPMRSSIDSPCSVTVWASFVWFESVISTGPAPTLFGDTVTLSGWMTPVNSSGTGGRGLFSKSSPPQPDTIVRSVPAARRATARNQRVFRAALIPRATTLTEPHRPPRGQEAVERPLD